MTIYLLRHGETDYNATKQYTGTLDIPVSQYGLSILKRADFDADIVYTSPLCRTAQTARVLFPDASLVPIQDFREMCFGDLEGQFYDLSADKNGAGFASTAKGGEARTEFCKRTCIAFEALVNKALEKGTEVLTIVAHGGTQMAILSTYESEKRPYEKWCGKNGGGFKLLIEREKWQKEKQLHVLGEVVFSK